MMTMSRRKLVTLVAIVVAALAAEVYTSGVLTPAQSHALAILVVASGLWVSEVVPLAATAVLIPLLQALTGVQGFKAALTPFFDTTVMLLLGGFMLAVAVEKYDLDEIFAYYIVSKVRQGAKRLALAVMVATAFLSMWISNSASTALLITMALKITESVVDKRGNFSKVMVLGIAYSATAGGLGTLVGTTTCAMAAASLKDLVGYEMSFIGWMMLGLPIALIQVGLIWLVLFSVFPVEVEEITFNGTPPRELTSKQRQTLAIFVVSVLAWLTGRLPDPLAQALGWGGHGLSSSMVSAAILVVLYFAALIDDQDLSRGHWPTLLLIGGGLSLGKALEVTGLVGLISDLLEGLLQGGGGLAALVLVVFASLGLSVIASNTASAGIFLPIAIGLAQEIGLNPVILGAAVGVATSLDFMLPVGTPPNAIAYSTGKVSVGEMVKAGFLLDLLGALVTILVAYTLWPLLV